MPALLIGLLVVLGPLLRGSWDLWAQSLLFELVLIAASLGLIVRLAVGYLPTPSRGPLLWAGVLCAMAGVSAALSPISWAAWPAWRVLSLGLIIFPAVTLASKDERAWIDEGIRAAAWTLVLLAFYQHFREHLLSPPAALFNANVFAGALLLFLPLAVQKEDWILTGGLLWCLLWSHSVGAWLGLSGALMLMKRKTRAFGYWSGVLIGAACLVAIYAKFQSPEVMHRWVWWKSAASMAAARPWQGFGPGSFSFVSPLYQGAGIFSVYVHEHFLETAAEQGVPYLFLWVAGLAFLLSRGGEHKRFGAAAILIQSLWDYPLSIPANYWLFCYFAASSLPESRGGFNIKIKPRAVLALAVAASSFLAGRLVWRRWEADRLKSQAMRFWEDKRPDDEIRKLLIESISFCDDPDAERFLAELDLRRVRLEPGSERPLLTDAAARLEASLALNPYRLSGWTALEAFYRKLGDQPAVLKTRERAQSWAARQ